MKHKFIPAEPDSRENLDLSSIFLTTINNQNFLLADDRLGDRIIVFGSPDFFRKMCSTDTLYSDGTFYSVPKIFLQLYTIHGFYKGEMMPFIFALLPNKSTNTYLRLFRILQDKAAEFNCIFSPKIFLIDFELEVKNAIRIIFPQSEIKGCLFHFAQALIRNLQNFGLTDSYRDDNEFKRLVRRSASLTFLPLEDISDAWNLIMENAPQLDETNDITKYMDYFVENWMDNENRFPKSMWNHYMNYGTRTVNHLEGWHNTLNRLCGSSHKNIFEFIRILKDEQIKFENKVLILDAGYPPKNPRKKYRDNNAKIKRLTEQYNNGTSSVLEFLDAVSFTIL